MHKKSVIWLLILSCLCSMPALSETITHGGEGDVFIKAIDLGWGIKRVNITLSKPVPIEEGQLECRYSAALQVQADERQENIDYILSVSLAAYLSNKPVRVTISLDECALGGRYKLMAVGL